MKKYFTPKEARQTLPLVKKIVEDILIEGRQLRTLTSNIDKVFESDPAVKVKLGLLKSYMNELDEIGCYYKDWNFTLGLIDFPAIIDGKDVFLCWRSDEDEIRFFHPVEEGYEGRHEIPMGYFV